MSIFLRGDLVVNGQILPPDSRSGLLLAYLCLANDLRAARSEVAEALWPSQTHPARMSSLRQALHQARKQYPIESDDRYLWLKESDTDLHEFREWKPLLAGWKHPWAESAREADRRRHSETSLRRAIHLVDPIAKIEHLLRGLESDPLDEQICEELVELYYSLGWKSEAAIQLRSFDRAARASDVAVTSSKLLGFLRPVIDSSSHTVHGLSRQQQFTYTIGNFYALFTSGRIQQALGSVEAMLAEGGLTREQESHLNYCRVRSLFYIGQATAALDIAQRCSSDLVSQYDVMLRGFALYLGKRYAEASELLSTHPMLSEFSDELYCESRSLLATTCMMSSEQARALAAISDGLARARQIGYRFSEMALKVNRMTAQQVAGSSEEHLMRYEELIEYAERFGFTVQLNMLRASKGKALREAGRLAEAEQVLLQSIEDCDKNHHYLGLGIALDYLGETYISGRKYSEAALQFQRSAMLRREFGEHIGMATSYRGAGLALLGMSEHKLASRLLRKCLAIYKQAEDQFRIGVCCIFLSAAEEPINEVEARSAWQAGIIALSQSGVDAESIRYELGPEMWDRVAPELRPTVSAQSCATV